MTANQQPRAEGSPTSRAAAAPTRSLGTFTSYAEAERVVDFLSDQGFQVSRVRIIGEDLRLVEQVTGRMTSWNAALRGAGSGAFTGFLIGWVFGLFDWIDPLVSSLVLALYGIAFGAIIGGLLGWLFHALQRGERDFASVSGVTPSRYEVLVDAEVADEAIRLLQDLPSAARLRGR